LVCQNIEVMSLRRYWSL